MTSSTLEWAPKVMEFQRKKNDIEAIRLIDNVRMVAKWCGGIELEATKPQGYIRTPEDLPVLKIVHILAGEIYGSHGDWVVKDEDGRFTIIPNAIFTDEYEMRVNAEFESEKESVV